MSELIFKGPFHFSEINSVASTEDNKTGIYIWGFMFEFDNKGLTNLAEFPGKVPLFDETKMKFIPYYVGLRKDNVFKRLEDHQNVKKDNARKYIRLSHEYLKKFYSDPEFPINDYPRGSSHKYNEKILNFIEPGDLTKITYFNTEEALKKIYSGQNIQINSRDSKNYPITLQMKEDASPLVDSLFEIVDSKKMNNFWFCYLIVPKDDNAKLRELETITYYSLKGKTISHTDRCPKLIQIEIADKTNTVIFNKINDVIQPTVDFKGY